MLKFTILSDVQSELMQGGSDHTYYDCHPKPKCRRGGHAWGKVRRTTKNITVSTCQIGNSAAINFGHGSANSSVTQTSTNTITA